jgi:peptide/nickel transport system substrate-binding protein
MSSRAAKTGFRYAGVVATLVVLSLAAVACGSSSTTKSGAEGASSTKTYSGNLPANEGTPRNGGALVWGLEAESDSLSPVTGRWAMSAHMVGSAIFDPVATMDASGKTVPYLAKSFTPSADFRTWTIAIRPDIRFQDGTPFDADALVLNINTDRAALIPGKAWKPVTSVTKTGPLTVEVKLNQPWATFPNVFLGQSGYMVAPATLADVHGGEHPIGTGPFKFKEWVVNDHVTVVRNPDYWQKGLPHLDQITFKPIPSAADRLAALEDGTIDATDMVTSQQVAQIRANTNLQRLEYNRGEELFVPLNTQQPPFNNIHARLALAYATDRARFVKELGEGIYTDANGMFAPGQLGYTANSGYPPYDLAKAKQEVAEYTKETGQPLTFTLVGVAEVAYASQDQLLKSMWEAAGAHVTLQQQDQAQQVIDVVLGKYTADDFRLFGQPDPDADFYWWASTSVGAPGDVSLNFPRFATPQTDAALQAGRATTDTAKRDAAYQQFEKLVNAQVPYIWLARTDWTIASTKKVHGYAAAGNGSISTIGPKTWVKDLWVDQ